MHFTSGSPVLGSVFPVFVQGAVMHPAYRFAPPSVGHEALVTPLVLMSIGLKSEYKSAPGNKVLSRNAAQTGASLYAGSPMFVALRHPLPSKPHAETVSS